MELERDSVALTPIAIAYDAIALSSLSWLGPGFYPATFLEKFQIATNLHPKFQSKRAALYRFPNACGHRILSRDNHKQKFHAAIKQRKYDQN